MKKIGIKRQIWLHRNCASRHKLQLRVAGYRAHSQIKNTPRLKTTVVMMPRYLIAEKIEQRREILSAIHRIHKCLAGGGVRVKLDFSRVEKIYPGGMLLLLASLSKLTETYLGRLIARCPPSSLAGQLLNHFGLAHKLRISHSLSKPTAASVIAWSFLTGTNAAGEQVTELLDRYRQGTNADIPEGLFAALTEGLTNVRHHAYKDLPALPEAWKKWWLFARYEDPKEGDPGSLYIAIYDMGSGIPATMRNKLKSNEIVIDFIEKSGKVLSLSDGIQLDKRLLFSAVEHQRSQTGLTHRGNGLPEMREFVTMTEGGKLHIVTDNVQYSYSSGAQEGVVVGYRDDHLDGTLLMWSIRLKIKGS